MHGPTLMRTGGAAERRRRPRASARRRDVVVAADRAGGVDARLHGAQPRERVGAEERLRLDALVR